MAQLLTRGALALLVLGAAFGAHAQQQDPRAQRGFIFVKTNCASCHSIDKVRPSPLKVAPPCQSFGARGDHRDRNTKCCDRPGTTPDSGRSSGPALTCIKVAHAAPLQTLRS